MAAMADRGSLRGLGFILAGVTAAVIVTAAWSVNAHLNARNADRPQAVTDMSAKSTRK